jgi:hypothetical protein
MNDRAKSICDTAAALQYSVAASSYMDALRQLNLLAEDFTELASDLAQAAYDAGATKKAIAAALGVPASTFRGMDRRVAA